MDSTTSNKPGTNPLFLFKSDKNKNSKVDRLKQLVLLYKRQNIELRENGL